MRSRRSRAGAFARRVANQTQAALGSRSDSEVRSISGNSPMCSISPKATCSEASRASPTRRRRGHRKGSSTSTGRDELDGEDEHRRELEHPQRERREPRPDRRREVLQAHRVVGRVEAAGPRVAGLQERREGVEVEHLEDDGDGRGGEVGLRLAGRMRHVVGVLAPGGPKRRVDRAARAERQEDRPEADHREQLIAPPGARGGCGSGATRAARTSRSSRAACGSRRAGRRRTGRR